MKKTFLVLSIIFSILTFVGMAYILMNGGRENAGYAVLPMVLAVVFKMCNENKKK